MKIWIIIINKKFRILLILKKITHILKKKNNGEISYKAFYKLNRAIASDDLDKLSVTVTRLKKTFKFF